jgi:hypothetical protein
MLYREYPPEINDLLEEGAGLGLFYPKYYSFAASDFMNQTGEYFNGSGNSALTNAFSTGPRPINVTMRPGEYFWCTTIYCSYTGAERGGVTAMPTLSFSCSEGKKFVDAFMNPTFGQLQDFMPLVNMGGPGFVDGTNQNSLYYPAPFRYVFSPYTTVKCEMVHPGGNDINCYVTLSGFAQEIKQ